MKLEALKIDQFRGIRDLELNNMEDVNIILGDNDVGKTTVLEALNLFECPEDFASILRASRMRLINRYSISQEYYTLYETFLHMFPFSESTYKRIAVSARIDGHEYSLEIAGDLGRALSLNDGNNKLTGDEEEAEREISVFMGWLSFDGKKHTFEISENDQHSTFSKIRPNMNIEYLAPGQHLSGSSQAVFRSKFLEDQAVQALKIIDRDIEGVKLVPSESRYGSNPVIEHRLHGEVPLYACGDGLKKIFLIASILPVVKNGILMIDEIETSLQAKHLQTVFGWLLNACAQFRVQLYVTTHSAEAISAMSGIAVDSPRRLACYRLERQGDSVKARRFSQEKLENLVNGSGIDVR